MLSGSLGLCSRLPALAELGAGYFLRAHRVEWHFGLRGGRLRSFFLSTLRVLHRLRGCCRHKACNPPLVECVSMLHLNYTRPFSSPLLPSSTQLD